LRLAEDAKSDVREYFYTQKRGHGISRQETEFPISQDDFETLWPNTKGWRLQKDRLYIPAHPHTIELDLFKGGKLGKLAISEIEFSSERIARAYNDTPEWFGLEITGVKGWGNSHLAKKGLPTGYIA